jgi:hypothetical protein
MIHGFFGLSAIIERDVNNMEIFMHTTVTITSITSK